MSKIIELATTDQDLAKKRLNQLRKEERFRGQLEGAMLMLGEGDLAVELGAGLGGMTQELLATGATVVAYEADPLAIMALKINTRGRENLEIVEAAAMTEDGKANITRAPNYDTTNPKTTKRSTMLDLSHKNFGNAEEVDTKDVIAHFEELIKTHGKIDFLMMDITGSELAIFEALVEKQLFDKIRFTVIISYQRDFKELNGRFRKMRETAEKETKWHILLKKI